jgi:hypothetical protein
VAALQSTQLLLDSPVARVYDVVCRERRSPYGATMFNAVTQIGLPRRGVFLMERRGERVVIDTPHTAIAFGPDDEYRIDHPTDGGDEAPCLSCRLIWLRMRLAASRVESGAFFRGTTSVSAWSLAPCATETSISLRRRTQPCYCSVRYLEDLGMARHEASRAAQRLRVEQVRALLAVGPEHVGPADGRLAAEG